MAAQSAAQQTGSAKPGQKAPDFLVHEDGDSVGVIVVEGIKAGAETHRLDHGPGPHGLHEGSRTTFPLDTRSRSTDLAVGDSVIKYGVNIGKVVAPIKKGEHVHVHNLKTRRW